MSLDITLRAIRPTAVYDTNITHNLGEMAGEVGIYECLWRPEEVGITKAGELIAPLLTGLNRLKGDPDHFRQFDAPNGWGTYDDFVPWLEELLAACQEYPDATVEASR